MLIIFFVNRYQAITEITTRLEYILNKCLFSHNTLDSNIVYKVYLQTFSSFILHSACNKI